MPISQHLLSDEVREIINYKPGWVISKGNVIFATIFILLLSLAFIIRYPDTVKASVRISALKGPKPLISKADGRVEQLLCTNGQFVTTGQTIAYLQTTGRHEQVEALRKWIMTAEPKIQAGNVDILSEEPMPQLNELGDLQAEYQLFQNTVQETVQILSNGFYQKKKLALLTDLQYDQQLQQNLERQQVIQQEDYSLQQVEYSANKKLVDEKVIAPIEFNQNKSKLLAKKQSLEQLSTQLINTEVSKHNKTKEILELEKYISDQKQKLQSSLLTLKSKMMQWEEKYTIVAPEDGRLEFISLLQENQLVNNGQELFFVQPLESTYYAEMKAGQANLGKIKKNQPVSIYLESYPSREFGYLNGTISYIATLPNAKDSFLIKVMLPDGLVTSYNKNIQFRNNLAASADIVVAQKRLIDKFWESFRGPTGK